MQGKPTKAFWYGYNALYGTQPLDITQQPKKRKKRNHDEESEQIKYNYWAAAIKLPWYHPANGGSRHKLEAVKFKSMGVKKGVSDIILPVKRSPYSGLVIELKRIDGKMSDLSEEQILWLNWYARNGWMACVAFGFEKAKKFTEDYLGVSTGRCDLAQGEKWFDLEIGAKVSLLETVRT